MFSIFYSKTKKSLQKSTPLLHTVYTNLLTETCREKKNQNPRTSKGGEGVITNYIYI